MKLRHQRVEGHLACLELHQESIFTAHHLDGTLIGHDATLLVGNIAINVYRCQRAFAEVVFVEPLLQYDDALAIADTRDEVDVVGIIFTEVQSLQLPGLG